MGSSWLQQPGKWIYNPMPKSATITWSHAHLHCTRPTYTYSMVYSKMNYDLHVHGPIRRWSIYCLFQQSYTIWKMMFVMITGGEYCNFHRVITCEISSQVSQTNTTRVYDTNTPGWEAPPPRKQPTAATTRYTWSLAIQFNSYIRI